MRIMVRLYVRGTDRVPTGPGGIRRSALGPALDLQHLAPGTLHSGTLTPGTLTLNITISPRGEERLQNGHPWIYRSDRASRAHAAGGDTVQVAVDARPAARVRALQRPIGDCAAAADPAATSRRPSTCGGSASSTAIAYRASLDIDATRLPARARRGRSPARRSSSIATATTWWCRRCRRAATACCRSDHRGARVAAAAGRHPGA